MKNYCFLVAAFCALFGCSENNKQTSAAININETKTDTFFPVTSFIRGQILILDSLPVTPLQVTIIKGKSDSVWLTKEALMPLLEPFLNPVINETNWSGYFKETRFNDQTINAITFTYDPEEIIPDSIALRHWDVYVDPETGNVTKVYIVKQQKDSNQTFTQQLTWQTNIMAKISTILNKPDGNMELLKEVIFIWNFQ